MPSWPPPTHPFKHPGQSIWEDPKSVEVTEARSPRYLEIGEKLMKEIKTKDLSKKDAVALREKIVLKHPATLGPSS